MRIVDFISMFYLNELIHLKLMEEGTTFIHSHAKFHEDFYKFKKFFDSKLAEIFHDYIILASAMEITSAWQSCEESPYWFLGEKIYFLNNLDLEGKIHTLNLKAYYKMAKYIFGEAHWTYHLFGGEKWYKAVKINELYGKIDNTMYCDAIIDLQHNTGSLLDKETSYFRLSGDEKKLRKIIQRKASDINFDSLFEFLLECSFAQDKRIFDIYWRFITLYLFDYTNKKYWLCVLQNSMFYRGRCHHEFFEYEPIQYIGEYKEYEIEFSDYIQEEYNELLEQGGI